MKTYIKVDSTKQLHRADDLTSLCNVNPEEHGTCGWLVAWILLTFCGWDGCGHCWPKKSKINAK